MGEIHRISEVVDTALPPREAMLHLHDAGHVRDAGGSRLNGIHSAVKVVQFKIEVAHNVGNKILVVANPKLLPRAEAARGAVVSAALLWSGRREAARPTSGTGSEGDRAAYPAPAAGG